MLKKDFQFEPAALLTELSGYERDSRTLNNIKPKKDEFGKKEMYVMDLGYVSFPDYMKIHVLADDDASSLYMKLIPLGIIRNNLLNYFIVDRVLHSKVTSQNPPNYGDVNFGNIKFDFLFGNVGLKAVESLNKAGHVFYLAGGGAFALKILLP